jgi:hypothetical protein
MSVAAIPIASRKPTTSNTRLVISLSPSRLRHLAAFGRKHHQGLAHVHHEEAGRLGRRHRALHVGGARDATCAAQSSILRNWPDRPYVAA